MGKLHFLKIYYEPLFTMQVGTVKHSKAMVSHNTNKEDVYIQTKRLFIRQTKRLFIV